MSVKETVISLLQSTNRPGMDKLINHMEEKGFFEGPCSAGNHLACKGGLAEHSLNVYQAANRTVFVMYPEMNEQSLIIACLLHDLGKMGQFDKQGYVENILASGKQSATKPYAQNKELLQIDHEIRSIQIASKFIDLTEEESFAILYHNGLYVPLGRTLNGNETPLQMILHFADMWCSRVVEREGEE